VLTEDAEGGPQDVKLAGPAAALAAAYAASDAPELYLPEK
jgi:hypothetical protein